MARALEVVLFAVAALIIMMPRPTLDAESALKTSAIELEQVAELEDAHVAHPEDALAATNLADAYLRYDHPEWALQTLARYKDSGEPRVYLLRGIAHADRLEVQAGLDDCKRGVAACDKAPDKCSPLVRQKLDLIQQPLQALIDAHVDPAKDPLAARTAVGQALRATKGQAPKTPGDKPSDKN
jgi:hypothetical protein